MAHPQTNFSSNFQGVDPPLEGYWHDDPIPCGGGNVVTDIWPNPAGVPVVVKGFNALTPEDIVDKLDKTGDASNTTSTFTKATGDASSMTSGNKLSAIFTAISSFFASVASALGGKADKANITGATKCKITYNGQGIITSGADLGASDIPNLSASKITSGQFGTDRIADDAITADKVKDNETLPVNIGGTATHLSYYGLWDTWAVGSYNPAKPYVDVAEVTINNLQSDNNGAGEMFQLEFGNTDIARFRLDFKINGGNVDRSNVVILESTWSRSALSNRLSVSYFKFDNDTKLAIRIYIKFTSLWEVLRIRQLDAQTGDSGFINWKAATLYSGRGEGVAAPVGTNATMIYNLVHTNNAAVGSTTTPVYVDSDGQVRPCTQGATLKTNTATLYISGYYNTTPVYHVKDIKNGCVNYVHVKDTSSSNCNLTIEAPALAAGEEYDYVVVFDTFTNNNLVGNIDVENCKTTGHFENGVFVNDAMAISNVNPQYVPMIVVTGNVARPQLYDRT